jgi:hypothetical protein
MNTFHEAELANITSTVKNSEPIASARMERCIVIRLGSHLATITLKPRLVPRHKQAVLRFNRDMTRGQSCKVSIMKDGSA